MTCASYFEPLPHICLHKLEKENLLFCLSFEYILEANLNIKQAILIILQLFRHWEWTFFFKPFPNYQSPKSFQKLCRVKCYHHRSMYHIMHCYNWERIEELHSCIYIWCRNGFVDRDNRLQLGQLRNSVWCLKGSGHLSLSQSPRMVLVST
jgi:hypothetical protein